MANQTLYPYGTNGQLPSSIGIINDLTTGGADKALSAEMGKELNRKFWEFRQVSLPAHTAAFIWYNENIWGTGSPFECVLLPVQPDEIYRITANLATVYAVLASGSPSSGRTPNYASGYTNPELLGAGETVEITIPEDGAFVYIPIRSSATGNDYTPSSVVKFVEDGKISAAVKKYAAQGSKFPAILHLGEETNIIYSIDDFLMAHDYDEGQNIDNLKFSNDLGETWITRQNIWGIIINVFMFADGTLFFAAKNNNQAKCYWTRDFETFTECTVLDQADEQGNRSAYTAPEGQNRWGVIAGSSTHTYIDEVEHYLFGDYVLSTSNPRVWYAISDANGVTVRCAFVFGRDKINGVTIPARHYHGFIYNPYNKYCYVLSGDNSDAECNVLRGRHDANHVWTWERLAYGVAYKIGDVVFDEGSMYFTTDYTDSSLVDKKGLISCPINDINVNRFRYWFHPSAAFMLEGSYRSSNPAAISSFIQDNHGWRILSTDYAGNSKVLIAKGGHNFVWVDNDKNVKFKFFIGANNNGDVYAWTYAPGYSVSGEDWIKFSHRKTINITEAMRNSGATDFFDGWFSTPR